MTDEASYMMFCGNDKAGVQLLKCSNPRAIKQTSIVLQFILSENYKAIGCYLLSSQDRGIPAKVCKTKWSTLVMILRSTARLSSKLENGH